MADATLYTVPIEDDSWYALDNALGLTRAQKLDPSQGDKGKEPDVISRRGRPEGDDQQRSGLLVVSPPLPLDALARLPQENSTLLQCITAMAVNVHGYGWDLEYVGPPEEDEPTIDPNDPNAPQPEPKVKPAFGKQPGENPFAKKPTGQTAEGDQPPTDQQAQDQQDQQDQPDDSTNPFAKKKPQAVAKAFPPKPKPEEEDPTQRQAVDGAEADQVAPEGDAAQDPNAPPALGPDGKPLPPKLGPDGKPLPPKLGPDGKPLPPQALGPDGLPIKKGPPKTGPESKEAVEEAIRIRTFLLTCNARESLDSLRYKLCMDFEGTGNAFWELRREKHGEGDVAGIDHLPSYTMRLTPLDNYETPVEATMVGVDGEIIKRSVQLRFRRYVQIQQGRYVYFKELGDPREISAFNGRPLDEIRQSDSPNKPAKPEGVTPEPQRVLKFEQLPSRGEMTSGLSAASLTPLLQPEDPATEVLHFVNVYLSDSPYGGTKYMGNIPSIRGARYTELVNLQFFRKNAVPAMIVLVSGGGLTPESKAQIREYFKDEFQGLANVQRVLVLEAVSQTSSVEAQRSTVAIDVKPLQDRQQSDGYFLNYGQRCRENIAASFRLPSIYLGYSDSSNYATAQASRITAEEQVFQPERNAFDEVINMRLLRPMGCRFWRFFSKGPAIADVASYTAAMQAFSAMGALTPNTAIELMNELLDTEVDPILQAWGDYPFPIVLGLLGSGKLAGVEEIEKAGPDPMEMMAALAGGGGPPGFGGPPGPPFGKKPSPFGPKPGFVPGGTPAVPEEGQTKPPLKFRPGDTPGGQAAQAGIATKGDEGDVPSVPMLYVVKGVRDLQRGLAIVQQQLSTMAVRKSDMSAGDLAAGGMLVPQQGRRMKRRRPGWR